MNQTVIVMQSFQPGIYFFLGSQEHFSLKHTLERSNSSSGSYLAFFFISLLSGQLFSVFPMAKKVIIYAVNENFH